MSSPLRGKSWLRPRYIYMCPVCGLLYGASQTAQSQHCTSCYDPEDLGPQDECKLVNLGQLSFFQTEDD